MTQGFVRALPRARTKRRVRSSSEVRPGPIATTVALVSKSMKMFNGLIADCATVRFSQSRCHYLWNHTRHRRLRGCGSRNRH